MLPAIVSFDGYITSHQKHNVEVFEDLNDVRNFVGEKRLDKDKYFSDLSRPLTVGSHMTENMMENKYQAELALMGSLNVYKEVMEEYATLTGRRYDPIEVYGDADAEVAL